MATSGVTACSSVRRSDANSFVSLEPPDREATSNETSASSSLRRLRKARQCEARGRREAKLSAAYTRIEYLENQQAEVHRTYLERRISTLDEKLDAYNAAVCHRLDALELRFKLLEEHLDPGLVIGVRDIVQHEVRALLLDASCKLSLRSSDGGSLDAVKGAAHGEVQAQSPEVARHQEQTASGEMEPSISPQAAHVSADPLRNAAALIPESAHSTEKSSDYELEEQEGHEAAILQIRPLLMEPLLLDQLADPNSLSEEIIVHSILLRRRSEWTESDSAYIEKCLCSGTLESMAA